MKENKLQLQKKIAETMSQMKITQVPADFDAKLHQALVAERDKRSQVTVVTVMPWHRIMSLAAGLLIAISVGLLSVEHIQGQYDSQGNSSASDDSPGVAESLASDGSNKGDETVGFPGHVQGIVPPSGPSDGSEPSGGNVPSDGRPTEDWVSDSTSEANKQDGIPDRVAVQNDIPDNNNQAFTEYVTSNEAPAYNEVSSVAQMSNMRLDMYDNGYVNATDCSSLEECKTYLVDNDLDYTECMVVGYIGDTSYVILSNMETILAGDDSSLDGLVGQYEIFSK